MRMSPPVLIFGTLIVIWAAFFGVVLLPTATIKQTPSETWRRRSIVETKGRELYIQNGCTYCHSQYIRPQDWPEGDGRISQPGDYSAEEPQLLGSERTGPDLSQEGGQRSNDWQRAHFNNPRSTRPLSLMPRFEYLGKDNVNHLISYVQSLGGTTADYRMDRQERWRSRALTAFNAGSDANFEWLHSHVPSEWRNMPNPYPADTASLARGQRIYEVFCIGCHGPIGDGQGIAARDLMPVPVDFTALRRNLPQGKFVGGLIYYQVMNGITGTAMPYFKKELESDRIWDVSNFVARNFVNYTDTHLFKSGIEAAYITPPAPKSERKRRSRR